MLVMWPYKLPKLTNIVIDIILGADSYSNSTYMHTQDENNFVGIYNFQKFLS